MSHLSPLQTALVKTLAYFNLFDFPLTLDEIKRYLLEVKDTEKEIQAALTKLTSITNSPPIETQADYYFLKGRSELVAKRQAKNRLAKKLLRKSRRFGYFWQTIPFIKMIAIANNLAFDNPEPTSDIDLLVITQKNRLFTARALMTFWTHLFGVRRHHQKIAGRFCLSFYLSEDALDLTPIALKPTDIYLAYWLHTLKPIFDQDRYVKLIHANHDWYQKYFPVAETSTKPLIRISPLLRLLQKIVEKILSGRLGNLLEKRLQKWQLKRASAKKSQTAPAVVITEKMLKFHENDRRAKILKDWQEKFKNIMV